jgi:hypothetical protein
MERSPGALPLGWHSGLCAAVLAAKDKSGFWIIGLLMSAAWAFVFSVFAHIFSNGDMVWTYIILGLGFVLMVGLHLKVKDA